MKMHEKIKELRKLRGLSQQKLAFMCGYSDRSAIAHIESGRVDLTRSRIEIISKALNVSMVELLCLDENINTESTNGSCLDGGVNEVLKDRLREARKAANMKQWEVAEEVGIKNTTYCGYETGKRKPDLIKLSAIASVLGVSVDYLLETGSDEKENTAATNGNGVDKKLETLIELIRQATPEQRDKLYEMMLLALKLAGICE